MQDRHLTPMRLSAAVHSSVGLFHRQKGGVKGIWGVGSQQIHRPCQWYESFKEDSGRPEVRRRRGGDARPDGRDVLFLHLLWGGIG